MDDAMTLLASTMALPFSAHPDDLPPDGIDLGGLAAAVPPALPEPLRPVAKHIRRVPLRHHRNPENDESPRLGTGFRV
jgi:hypothetical protein